MSISSLKRAFSSFRLRVVARRDEDKWEPIDSLGETGATVARNIRQIRKKRGLQYVELAEQLERLGREIPTWGLRKIESGGRRVDADDLVAIAVALGVSPASLLMPNLATVAANDLVPITGWQKPMTATVLWRWLTAWEPLIHGTFGTFVDLALPSWEREERLKPIMFPGENETDGDD